MSKFIIRAVPSGVKFDLRAHNGEIIATSEVYTSAAACRRGIESVRKCAASGRILDITAPEEERISNPRFELYQDKRGACRFRLRSRNGQLIARSEPYSTKAACIAGIESVMQNAPEAEVEAEA